MLASCMLHQPRQHPLSPEAMSNLCGAPEQVGVWWEKLHGLNVAVQHTQGDTAVPATCTLGRALQRQLKLVKAAAHRRRDAAVLQQRRKLVGRAAARLQRRLRPMQQPGGVPAILQPSDHAPQHLRAACAPSQPCPDSTRTFLSDKSFLHSTYKQTHIPCSKRISFHRKAGPAPLERPWASPERTGCSHAPAPAAARSPTGLQG